MRSRLRPTSLPALALTLLLALALSTLPAGAEDAPAPAATAPSPHHWTVLIQGHEAGEMTRKEAADGEEVWTFTFNDRGRGPELTTTIRYGAGAIPVSVTTTGHDYLKAPVEETFTRDGAPGSGTARWSTTDGDGSASLTGPAYYLSADSAAPELALLARALLQTEDHTLPVLPGGTARLQVLGTRTVNAGEHAATLSHVAVSGLGFTPETVWLDAGGGFFAVISGWVALVPDGWMDAVPSLREADDQSEKAYFAALPGKLARRPKALAVTGAAVFDPAQKVRHTGWTVVVEGHKITAAGPDGEVAIPEGAERIDAAGKTLLPGLWDMHVHLSPADGLLDLASGVTTVRDMANDVDLVTGLRKAWDEGSALGPRVVLAGILDGPGKYAGPTKALVDTPEEVREWVDRYASLGYEQIKIYSSVDPKLVPVIVQAAKAHGLRVSGHIPQGLSASEAVDLGYDEIQHVNFLFLNFWAHEEGLDTRTPARFTTVAERAAGMDLQSPEVQGFIHKLAEKKIVIDPTVAVFESMFTTRPGEIQAAYRPVADRLPPQVRRSLIGGGLEPPPDQVATYAASYRKMLDLIAACYHAGVPIVAGTDAMAGFTLDRELELYVEAGIPAPEVLRIATLGAARVVGLADEVGSIEPGKLADLILVDGDPTTNISDIRNVDVVVKDGMVMDPAALDRTLGVTPR